MSVSVIERIPACIYLQLKLTKAIREWHERIWGSGRMGTRIFKLCRTRKCAVAFTSRNLYPRYAFHRNLCLTSSKSGRFRKQNPLLPPKRIDHIHRLSRLHCSNYWLFYIRGSVHRNSRLKKSNEMQQNADINLLLNHSTCFGRPSRPSSGLHKTVVAASGTDHTIWGTSFLKRDQISPYLVTFEEASFPDNLISTRGCNYSFMYSWRWARWTPETC